MGVAERRAREKEELKQAILDAAGQLIVEHGYENLSIRKIAEKVEYSPATIYLYFNDKAEILASICASVFAELTRKLGDLAASETDSIQGLRRGFRCYIEFGVAHASHYMVTFGTRWPADYAEQPAMNSANELGLTAFGCLAQAIQRAVDAGKIPPGNINLQAQLAWTALHGLTSTVICMYDDPHFPWAGLEDLIEGCSSMILRGLGADVPTHTPLVPAAAAH